MSGPRPTTELLTVPTILALDVAGRMGVCEWTIGKKPIFLSIAISGDDEASFEALRRNAKRATKWIAARMKLGGITDIVIEAPIGNTTFGNTNATTTALTFVRLGAILGPLGLRNVSIADGKVNTVRKHFIGVGNLKKAQAKPRVMRMCNAIGWWPDNYDEADAGALAHWRAHQLGLADYIPDNRPHIVREG